MQKENLMESAVPAGTPAPAETPASGELAAAVESPAAVPVAPCRYPAQAVKPDGAVIDAIVAARGKIATRLDALKERVLARMDVKEAPNAWVLEDLPERLLEQAARITRGLQDIGEYTGVEDEIAMREEAAQAPASVSGETGLTLVFIPVKNSANGEQADHDALLAALNDTAAVRRDNPAVNAVIAARGKIVTRLDALKEYVLSYMDAESLRDAWDLEAPPQSMLEEAEQILSDLREIDGYAGLEEAVD